MYCEGIIKNYSLIRGFGFVKLDESDYFVHVSSIDLPDKEKVLIKGEKVMFSPSKNAKGLIAKNVKPIFINSDKRISLLSKHKSNIAEYRLMSNNKVIENIRSYMGSDFEESDLEQINQVFRNAYDQDKDVYCFEIPNKVRVVIVAKDLHKQLDGLMPLIKEMISTRKFKSTIPGMEFEVEESGDSKWGYVAVGVGVALCAAGVAIAYLLNSGESNSDSNLDSNFIGFDMF